MLYKFGQIIFTHNSDNDKKSSNKIDYKIVDNGLNKFFPERNFEPVDIETINKNIADTVEENEDLATYEKGFNKWFI